MYEYAYFVATKWKWELFASTALQVLKVLVMLSVFILLDVLLSIEFENNLIYISYVLFAFVMLTLIGVIDAYLNIHVVSKVADVLVGAISNNNICLGGGNSSIKSRALMHIIDNSLELGLLISAPLSFILVLMVLAYTEFPILLPITVVLIVLALSSIVSRFRIVLGNDIAEINRKRSNAIGRVAKYHFRRNNIMPSLSQLYMNSTMLSELKLRNKESFLDELTNYVPMVLGIILASGFVYFDKLGTHNVLLFVFVSSQLTSLVSDVPKTLGALSKSAKLYDFLFRKIATPEFFEIWNGGIKSNTLMYSNASLCRDMIGDILGQEFLEKHEKHVKAGELSTGQRNVILALRYVMANKSQNIPDSLLRNMDSATKNSLLKNIVSLPV